MSKHEREERMEHGEKVNLERPMKGLRTDTATSMDSADSIRKGGGEDPRRNEAKIMIDHSVMDHQQSGYNHNGVKAPEAANGNNAHMEMMERKVAGEGTPSPDGMYSR